MEEKEKGLGGGPLPGGCEDEGHDPMHQGNAYQADECALDLHLDSAILLLLCPWITGDL